MLAFNRKIVGALLLLVVAAPLRAQTNTNSFVVCAYNLENWLEMERNHKPDKPKPASQRNAVLEILATIHPDVLGVEEMGTERDLAQLRDGLSAKGLAYPYHEWVQGADPVRHVALLSRFPIQRRYSRTDDTYRLNGKLMRISRGILDVEIHVNGQYWFRAIVAHLKSKRPVDFADQAVMRREEAQLLRRHIDQVLQHDSNINLLAMGDFNDTPDSDAITPLLAPTPFQLFALPAVDHTGEPGTHYWWKDHGFSRIDYLMVSPGMSNEFIAASAHVADPPHWQRASDHRAVSASFVTHDIGPVPLPPETVPEWLRPTLIAAVIALILALVLMALLVYVRRNRAAP